MNAQVELRPTEEQEVIVEAVRSTSDNIMINALAGTGKTTTLDLIQAASPERPLLCLAFNKKIAEEMEARFPSTTTVRTFNGLGHRVWAKTVSKVNLDVKKVQNILKELTSSLKGDDRQEARDAYWDIIGGVSLAKALGYVPEGKFPSARRLLTTESFHASLETKPSELTIELIDACLLASIKAAYAGSIDFNDQIYMPALFGGTFPRFPHVLVDEGQDLNPTNHVMLDKLVRGRISVVGDRWQSIYGFRGAVQEGMEKLRAKFQMQEFDLSISFRCPKAVVEAARWRVPRFRWVKDGGIVGRLGNPTAGTFQDASAIICRNNAPLFRLAFNLLAAKRSVQVSGSDIGPRLLKIMQKLGSDDTSKVQTLALIEAWEEAQLEKTNTPAKIEDMAACMKVFASFGDSLGQAVGYAEHLFKQQGTIKLMTGHKAKGLEFNVVYHLDPWLIGTSEQELNLRYVIGTRSADQYYELNSKEIVW